MSGGFRSRSAGRREDKPARNRQQGRQQGSSAKQQARKQGGGRTRYTVKGRPASIGDPAREAAFEVVLRVARDGAFANLTLPGILRERKITGRDSAFATELAYGTLRSLGVLDAVIAKN